MKLDRNTNPDGRGKYALIKLRDNPIAGFGGNVGGVPNCVAVKESAIDYGNTPETEFFVIRLADKFAANALHAYAISCKVEDPEFSQEVLDLANRAAAYEPKQMPT